MAWRPPILPLAFAGYLATSLIGILAVLGVVLYRRRPRVVETPPNPTIETILRPRQSRRPKIRNGRRQS